MKRCVVYFDQKKHACACVCIVNKTGLQPVSRPVKQILGFFQELKKVTKILILLEKLNLGN